MKMLKIALLLATAVYCAAPAWFTAMKDNTWANVASTGTIYAVRPLPEPPGAEGVSAVCNDWTGATANQATGEYLFVAQGGHNGYYGNEIYALSLRSETPAWQRIWGPTPNAQISTSEFGCNAAYTGYPDGSPRTTHGWFSNFVSNDGRMWVTLVDACPSGTWTTEVYSILRSNLSAGWTYHGRQWATVPGLRCGSTFGFQSGPGAYDPVGNKIYRSADFATDSSICEIDVAAAVSAGAQAHTGPRVPGSNIYDLYQVAFSNAWSVVLDDYSPRCWVIGSVSGDRLYISNLETSPGTFVQKTPTGTPTGFDSGVNGVYHRQSRSILVGGYEYGANIRRLSITGTNPLTAAYAWSAMPLDASNTVVPQAGMNGTLSKFQIINDMGNGQAAICLLTGVQRPTYVYKVPGTFSRVEQSLPKIRFSRGTHRADGIFDLNGRRMKEPRQSGIYLVCDKGKIIKKVYLR